MPTLGALSLDVCAGGIDILMCDGRTWCSMGTVRPSYVRHNLLDQFQPGAYVGAESVLGPQHDYNFTLQPNAERFNIGSASPLGVLGLKAALGLLHEVGMPAISERILDLRERDYASARCWHTATVAATWSSICLIPSGRTSGCGPCM